MYGFLSRGWKSVKTKKKKRFRIVLNNNRRERSE